MPVVHEQPGLLVEAKSDRPAQHFLRELRNGHAGRLGRSAQALEI
jgi:hypothetical protein